MSDWLQQLKIQASIRRSIIIHGNVKDIYWNNNSRSCQPIPNIVFNALQQMGYSEVVVWDRDAGGKSIVNPGSFNKICENAVSSNENVNSTNTAQAGMQAYEYDEDNTAQTTNNVSKTPEEFFSLISKRFISKQKEPIAFVVDWSDSLFGNSNSLSEAERVWLLLLGKAIREAPLDFSATQLDSIQDVLILITDKLAYIPPQFYQNTSAITDLYVPLPDRKKRHEFVSANINAWRFTTPLQPGTRNYEEFIDSLDQMTIRDIYQLMRLSRNNSDEPLTDKKLLTLYKYGEISSPWEDLSRSRLMELENTLEKSVKGQSEAIKKVNSVIVRAFSGLSGLQHSSRQSTPKGILFFVGPTGVGKTELAKAMARFLFGDEEACIRFDMSEFNHEHSDQRLVGAPPGYVGYEEGGQLTNAVKNRPFSVLLFDEIEKAHGRILDKFLQILEDGRLTDGKGETVSFSETIVIFTSNIGAADIHYNSNETEVRKEFLAKVKEHFVSNLKRPELLNRIGENIVPFNFINDSQILHKIINSKLIPIKDRLKEKYRIKDLILENEANILEALTANFDRNTGGRGVLNQLASKLIDPLAEYLFTEGEPEEFAGKTVQVFRVGKTSLLNFKLV